MGDIFKSSKRMLGRAKHHLADLERRIDVFQKQPWTAVVEKDADGVGNLVKVKFGRPIDEDLANIVFDCANNLRTVLDQMAFGIAVRHTTNASPKSAKFPFGPTETDMLNNRKGGCKDLPTEIGDLFEAFKPYKRGNNALWAMNELCNAPKHKLLYPLAMGYDGLGIGGGLTIGPAG